MFSNLLSLWLYALVVNFRFAQVTTTGQIAQAKPAVLQHRPAELHCDAEGRLHRDGGPVVRFRDGFAFWILHGVPVPKEIAETPGEQLDVQLVLSTQNADVRREILRKIGLERFIFKIGAKTIHAEEEYRDAEGFTVPASVHQTHALCCAPSCSTAIKTPAGARGGCRDPATQGRTKIGHSSKRRPGPAGYVLVNPTAIGAGTSAERVGR